MRKLFLLIIFLFWSHTGFTAVVCSSLTSGSDTADATSFNTASITPTANVLQLLAVTSRTATADIVVPTASGNSLTWVEVDRAPVSGNNRSVTVFRSMGASPASGAVNVSFGGQTQTSAIWSVVECSGVDTSGTNGSGAVVQFANQDPVSATSYTNTLSAFGSSNNAGYGAAMHIANEATTPGASWTELHDVAIAENTYAFHTQYKINDNVVNASWSSNVGNQNVVLEIKAESGSTTTTLYNSTLYGATIY